MSHWTAEDVHRALEAVAKRAASDLEYGKRALCHPDEVIKEMTGKDAPAGCRLKIIEHAPEFHLPTMLPDIQHAQRFRAELDAVADKLFS